jgi:hypothetical protein
MAVNVAAPGSRLLLLRMSLIAVGPSPAFRDSARADGPISRTSSLRRTRVWLSKRLFQDTYRLRDLAEGTSDVGVKRLEQASDQLAQMEADLLRGQEAAA